MKPVTTNQETHRAADVTRAVAIFLLIFAVYFIGYSRTLPPTADEMIDFGLAQSLAKWQVLSIDQVSTVGPNPEEFGIGNHRYSKYGPLQAVLSVPLFWLAQRLPIGAVDTVLLLNHLVTAFAMALLFLLVRRMGFRPAVGLAIVALVAFGTPLWIHSKRYFGEPTITFGVILTTYATYAAATTRRRHWYVLAGLAFGVAVASKYVNGLLLIPVPLYLALTAAISPRLGEKVKLVSRRLSLSRACVTLIWFGLGVAPVAGLLMWYDLARFGNPFESGYAHWESFSTPVWVGVSGFLLSPGKSIFVYTPLLLLLPFWAPAFVRRFPGFGALLGSIVALHLVLYGSWWVWWGAWAWGARFIVPILPLLALFLAEGFGKLFDASTDQEVHSEATAGVPTPVSVDGERTAGDQSPAVWRKTATRAVVAVLALLSFVIQVLGLSVDHTVYLVQLLPLNSKPDTLTLYDLRYQPILHQLPLMTRQWLDFAWIDRTGPSPIDRAALGLVLLGAGVAVGCFVVVWLTRGLWWQSIALGATAAVVALTTYRTLAIYAQTVDPTTAAIVQAFAQAPSDTGIVQLIPSAIVPYDNWQKRSLPETGWIEEPKPGPIVVGRIQEFERTYPRIWVVTQTSPKAPSNGVEAMLDRSLVQVGDEPVGGFRLLRYVTDPASLRLVKRADRFANGIELTGYVVNGNVTPGQQFDLTLAWRATHEPIARPDYTVFVHLVDDAGKLVAQHDDPPASGYLPTSSWTPGQTVYDDHAVVVAPDAGNTPANPHLVQVGLYLPSSGKRAALLGPDGRSVGDTVTLDLRSGS